MLIFVSVAPILDIYLLIDRTTVAKIPFFKSPEGTEVLFYVCF